MVFLLLILTAGGAFVYEVIRSKSEGASFQERLISSLVNRCSKFAARFTMNIG
jgi:hypothetical protein